MKLHSLFLIIFSLSFICRPAHAQENQSPAPIILILDGSGSMWGQIEGKTKIEIAREVVGGLMDGLEEERPLGLVVYGHRSKGDCEDIENLIETGTDNRQEIKTALNGINPTGKTPLANAALSVIDQLKTTDSDATIILVSDGAESCGGNLCEVVRAAKEAGVNFVLHVVGFDIGESDKLALECAAREGEGIYLDADNGDELSAALEQVSDLTVEDSDATLSVQVTKDDVLNDAVVQVYIEDNEDPIASLRTYVSEESNPAIFHLPSGTYQIRIAPIGSSVQDIWRRGVIVPADQMEHVKIDFTPGYISMRTTGNGDLWDSTVNISNSGESKHLTGGRTYSSSNHNPMIKELSPGTYDVAISAMKIKGAETSHIFSEVSVQPRDTIRLDHNFKYGEISILATNNNELWDCVINIFNAGDEKKRSVRGGRTYNSPNSNPSIDLFTPGRYSVNYRANHIHGTNWEHTVEDIEVRAGETTEVTHDYQTGLLRIGSEHNGAFQTVHINILQDGKSVYSKRSSPSSKSEYKDIVINPGIYEVEVSPIRLDSPAQKFSIEIVTGQTIEKVLQF